MNDDMTSEGLRALLKRGELSQLQAAREIGLGARMMRHYVAGTWPVPRYIWLALERVVETRERKEKTDA